MPKEATKFGDKYGPGRFVAKQHMIGTFKLDETSTGDGPRNAAPIPDEGLPILLRMTDQGLRADLFKFAANIEVRSDFKHLLNVLITGQKLDLGIVPFNQIPSGGREIERNEHLTQHRAAAGMFLLVQSQQ